MAAPSSTPTRREERSSSRCERRSSGWWARTKPIQRLGSRSRTRTRGCDEHEQDSAGRDVMAIENSEATRYQAAVVPVGADQGKCLEQAGGGQIGGGRGRQQQKRTCRLKYREDSPVADAGAGDLGQQ